ncbi:MAG TPA: hypothetical protein PKN52_02730 [Trueperaceae bacterium]|nr:hypothetical protein [Trueperaceae bacterium]
MEAEGAGATEVSNHAEEGDVLPPEARLDLASLSGEALTELCASLERMVTSGSAPLATYGELALAQAEVRRRESGAFPPNEVGPA